MTTGFELDWFLDLAETQHMGRTAAAVGLPQSSISRRLAALERELGAELFDRHGKQLRLNSRGRVFRDAAESAKRELEAGRAAVRRLMDPDVGTVRLDFMHSLGTWMVPQLVREYLAERPRADIHLHQDAGRWLVERVLAGTSDVALVGPRPEEVETGELLWVPLARQRLALAVPKGHPLERKAARRKKKDLPMAAAAEYPFVGMQPGYGTRLLLDEATRESGFEPNLVFESMELTTVIGLVSAGLGVALVPMDDPYLDPKDVTLIPIAPARYRDLGMVCRNVPQPPPVAAFRDFVIPQAGKWVKNEG